MRRCGGRRCLAAFFFILLNSLCATSGVRARHSLGLANWVNDTGLAQRLRRLSAFRYNGIFEVVVPPPLAPQHPNQRATRTASGIASGTASGAEIVNAREVVGASAGAGAVAGLVSPAAILPTLSELLSRTAGGTSGGVRAASGGSAGASVEALLTTGLRAAAGGAAGEADVAAASGARELAGTAAAGGPFSLAALLPAAERTRVLSRRRSSHFEFPTPSWTAGLILLLVVVQTVVCVSWCCLTPGDAGQPEEESEAEGESRSLSKQRIRRRVQTPWATDERRRTFRGWFRARTRGSEMFVD